MNKDDDGEVFWYFCNDQLGDGFTLHKTPEDARAKAEEALDYCRDAASDDGWPEETSWICWGRVEQQVTLIHSEPDTSGRFDAIEDYGFIADAKPLEEGQASVVKLTVGIDRERRDVAIDFGRQVKAIQFSPALALAISNLITEAAFSVDASLTEMAMREDAWPKLSVLMDGKEVACEIKLPKEDGDE